MARVISVIDALRRRFKTEAPVLGNGAGQQLHKTNEEKLNYHGGRKDYDLGGMYDAL